MIKYSYFRQASPRRDWVVDSERPPAYHADDKLTYMGAVEAYREVVRRRRTWHWLCNLDDAASRHVEDPRPYYELGSRPVDEIDA